MLQLEGLEEGTEEETGEEKEQEMEGEDTAEDGEISLHALLGRTADRIIKVKGETAEKQLMTLIDSGSTHSFLDEGTA